MESCSSWNKIVFPTSADSESLEAGSRNTADVFSAPRKISNGTGCAEQVIDVLLIPCAPAESYTIGITEFSHWKKDIDSDAHGRLPAA